MLRLWNHGKVLCMWFPVCCYIKGATGHMKATGSPSMNLSRIIKFLHVFSITTLGRRPFWNETNEQQSASRAWNRKLEVEEVGAWFVSAFQIPPSLPLTLDETTSSRWTAVSGMLSRTKAHCSAAQTKPQCARLLGKRGLCVCVTEKSKQSQVQREGRDQWKGVRKRNK